MVHDEESQAVAQRAAAAGAGALAGLAIGGPVGAITGAALGPALEPLIERVWGEARAEARDRGTAVIGTAIDALDEDADGFERRVVASEQTRLLAATAMAAGTATAWHPKVRALGRALAAGLAGDQAVVDEGQLIVGALSDLEAPHAQVLNLLVTKKWERGYRTGSKHSAPMTVDLSPAERPPRRFPEWAPEAIGMALPKLSGVIPTLLGTLQRHGLASPRYDLSEVISGLVTENVDDTVEISMSGGPDEPFITWSATELGLQLHTLLKEAADGPASGHGQDG